MIINLIKITLKYVQTHKAVSPFSGFSRRFWRTCNVNSRATIGCRSGMACLRMRRVIGHDARANDVIYHPPTVCTDAVLTFVFFAGDVQDYPEVMQAHRDNKNYLKWNLENMARMLSQYFPTHHIVVVRPSRVLSNTVRCRRSVPWKVQREVRLEAAAPLRSTVDVTNFLMSNVTVHVESDRIEYRSFSCYDNFVPSNNAGIPDHTPTHSALHHLERLLQGVSNRLKTMPTADLLEALTLASMPEEIDIEDLHNSTVHRPDTSDVKNGSASDPAQASGSVPMDGHGKPMTSAEDTLWWKKKLALDESRVTVCGFSKGCVVLNQLIYEFHYTQTLTPGDQHMMRFISRIESMYWLDGGHAGGKNTWITSRSLLETLTRLGVNIYIHVSPYQVQDEGRPWIGREEKTFTNMLRKLGAKVQRYLHDQPGSPHSLHMHFDVLANFKHVQDSTEALPLDSSDEET